jgi:hypothetical protein
MILSTSFPPKRKSYFVIIEKTARSLALQHFKGFCKRKLCFFVPKRIQGCNGIAQSENLARFREMQIPEENTSMTETVKKTSKPKAKSKAKASANSSSKKAAVISEAPKSNGAPSNLMEMKISREQVAQLAHRFWIERGHRHGYDAEDWFRAEQELRSKAS